jgi:hypothetical protein
MEPITKADVRRFAEALGSYCWHHDFHDFCALTGFRGFYAQDKWDQLKQLNTDLGQWDAETLAKILATPRP